jgi:hypothetical protein
LAERHRNEFQISQQSFVDRGREGREQVILPGRRWR